MSSDLLFVSQSTVDVAKSCPNEEIFSPQPRTPYPRNQAQRTRRLPPADRARGHSGRDHDPVPQYLSIHLGKPFKVLHGTNSSFGLAFLFFVWSLLLLLPLVVVLLLFVSGQFFVISACVPCQ